MAGDLWVQQHSEEQQPLHQTSLQRNCCPVPHQDRPAEELLPCAPPRPACGGAAGLCSTQAGIVSNSGYNGTRAERPVPPRGCRWKTLALSTSSPQVENVKWAWPGSPHGYGFFVYLKMLLSLEGAASNKVLLPLWLCEGNTASMFGPTS
ncbi:unnamed protein product [Boreogadus saida]